MKMMSLYYYNYIKRDKCNLNEQHVLFVNRVIHTGFIDTVVHQALRSKRQISLEQLFHSSFKS